TPTPVLPSQAHSCVMSSIGAMGSSIWRASEVNCSLQAGRSISLFLPVRALTAWTVDIRQNYAGLLGRLATPGPHATLSPGPAGPCPWRQGTPGPAPCWPRKPPHLLLVPPFRARLG